MTEANILFAIKEMNASGFWFDKIIYNVLIIISQELIILNTLLQYISNYKVQSSFSFNWFTTITPRSANL